MTNNHNKKTLDKEKLTNPTPINQIKNSNNGDNVENLKIKQEKIRLNICNLKKKIIDKKIRLQAKIENINKQTTTEINKINKENLKRFINKLIIIIDMLETLSHKIQQSNFSNNSTIQGINLTLKLLIQITKKIGLRKEGKLNSLFNPEVHQALTFKTTQKIPDNHILSIIKYGYTLNNELLRKAVVEVSKNNVLNIIK